MNRAALGGTERAGGGGASAVRKRGRRPPMERLQLRRESV
jgi:hypothetical protein